MAENVADVLLRRLREWDVRTVFGYGGDGINGLLAAWDRAGNQPEFVPSRHEELAAFEAVGYAKFSGRLGVCAATSGPGAIHLLNGLYDAKLDHVPVLAIVGQTPRSALGGSYQQEVDLPTLFKDVAADYLQLVTVPEQLPNVLDRAIRVATTRRTVTAVIVPGDVQELPYHAPTHESTMVPSSVGTSLGRAVPERDDLQRAADVLNSGSRVAIQIGQGAREAATEVSVVADMLGAGVSKALLGKDVLPDDLPWVTGCNGLLGTRASYELMRDCDTLLVVGSSFPYSQFLPEFGRGRQPVRAVQIDDDPTMLGMRYPFEVNLHGDARATLAALLPLLERKPDRAWRETVIASTERWTEVLERRAALGADPVNPERVFHELSPLLPDGALITADSGTVATWYARHLRLREGMRGTLSGTLASMCPALPYAVGAKFAHPDRPVIALVGDGAMQMNGINELISAAQHWRRWADPRLVVAVLNNGDLNQVTWELRALGGAPQFLPSQRLPEFPYAEYARGLGLGAIRVDEPDAVRPGWERALAADRPCVVEFVTDPSVPPIPPHATWDQAQNLGEALAKNDPEAWKVLLQGARTKVQDFLPGGGRRLP